MCEDVGRRPWERKMKNAGDKGLGHLVEGGDVIFRKLFSILLLQGNVVQLDLLQQGGRQVITLGQLGHPGQ